MEGSELLTWTLIFVFLVMNGFMVLFIKFEIDQKIMRIAMTKPNRITKFFFRMVECEFCVEHHLGILALIIWCAMVQKFEWLFCFMPFMSSGLSYALKKRK